LKKHLLDVNTLLALHDQEHIHHFAAREWFHQVKRRAFCTCPITQLGLIRLLCSPMVSNASPEEALTALSHLTGQTGHEFWPDDLEVQQALRAGLHRLRGHRQFTDAYLVALAARREGTIVTFDGGLAQCAAEQGVAVEFLRA